MDLETGRFKIKVPAQAMSLFLVCRLLPACWVLTRWGERVLWSLPNTITLVIGASRYVF